MKKPPKKKRLGGRPKKEIDWKQFDKLCEIHATLAEFACWFDCSEDTIENACKREQSMGFSDYFDKKSGKGKTSLRRRQFQTAMKGNVGMLIWLGKQWLGQTDKDHIDPRDALNITFKIGHEDDDADVDGAPGVPDATEKDPAAT